MSIPDLAFVEVARTLEVEAMEGGRPLSEFSVYPESDLNDEEEPVLGRPVDDIQESEERLEALAEFPEYARRAFGQRGLVYPFAPSASGDSMEVLPGKEDLALRVAELSYMVGKAHPASKEFERRAFAALQKQIGGWGVCVGSPRDGGHGPKAAVEQFRSMLQPSERGDEWPATFSPSGDQGADGFILLGRRIAGPIVFFQSKNSGFSLKVFPEEFARVPEILTDWFGKRLTMFRPLVSVCALNTILTLEFKDRIALARGVSAVQLVDAVDILYSEVGSESEPSELQSCTVL